MGLEYLAAHLALAGQREELHELMGERWAQLKEGREGTLALAGLIPYLPAAMLLDEYETLRTIAAKADEHPIVIALAELSPRLSPDAQGLLWELVFATLARTRAAATADDALYGWRDNAVGMALARLAPQLPDASVPRAWALAADLRAGELRDSALAALAPRLSEESIKRALAIVLSLQRPWARTSIVAALLPRVSGALREQLLQMGLEAVDRMGGGTDPKQVRELVAFLPLLDGADRARVYARALEKARDDRITMLLPLAFALIIPHAPETQREVLVAEALRDANRPDELGALAACGSPSIRAQLVDRACTLKYEKDRVQALSDLAPHLAPNELARALATAHEIQDHNDRLRLIRQFAPYLPPDLLPQALNVARGLRDTVAQAHALCALAVHVPSSHWCLSPDALLERVSLIADPVERIATIQALIPALPEPTRTQAWTRIPGTCIGERQMAPGGTRSGCALGVR